MLRTVTACTLSLLSLIALNSLALGQDDQNVLYDFSATWCGPCQQVAPIVDRLSREGLPVRKVDIDQDPALKSRYNITSVPTFVLVIGGKEVERRSGYMSESDMRRLVAKIPQTNSSSTMIAQGNSSSGSGVVLGEAGSIQRPESIETEQPQAVTKTAEAPSALARLNPFRKNESTTEPLIRGNDSATGGTVDGVAPRAEDPMQASVRIRVFIDGKINLGSGTVIASQPGHTVILTCGHIFRNFKQDSKIEVDFIQDGKSIEHVATVEKFDTEADLGVIVVATDQAMPVAPIAMRPHSPTVGDSVSGIGCSGGELPTRTDIEVTAIDRYEGPNNIECTGLPVQGRSGGGLFNRSGEVVGVCIAADRDQKRGLYSGLFAIHQILDECGLAHLYQPASAVQPEVQLASQNALLPASQQALPMPTDIASGNSSQPFDFGQSIASAPAPSNSAPAMTPAATGTSAQPVDLHAGRSEVVVIIRDPSNPQGENRVVIIHDASEKFMSFLNGELGPQNRNNGRMMSAAQPMHPINRAVRSDFTPNSVIVAKGLRNSTGTATLQQTSLSKSTTPQRFVRGQSSTIR